jgi:NTE family protein
MLQRAAGVLSSLGRWRQTLGSRLALAGRRKPSRRRPAKAAPKAIALALQGGGSHGAFTWGVLDRLLEDERLAITAVSGASAGAMNAAVLASGFLAEGSEGARQALASFWQGVSDAGRLSSLASPLFAWAPVSLGLQGLAGSTSPYTFNPLDLNPLRSLLERHVDFARLRRNRRIRLVVSATNVHTGSPRHFRTREISSEVLLASACLPHLYKAVEIDGAYYWDGGFTANPAILPLIERSDAGDILVVHIDTEGHPALPTTGSEISGRLNRILMNAPLLREIQTINDFRTLADRRSALGKQLRRVALHHILPPEDMLRFEATSKLDTDWRFLTKLRDFGRASAEIWLEANYRRLGTGSAVDLDSSLMAPSLRLENLGLEKI